jgi:hypothetical protein
VAASRSSRSATAVGPRSSSLSTLDPERRSALLAAKLGALARDNLGLVEGEASPFPGGAALRVGDAGVVLVQDAPARGLGPALAWAHRQGVGELHVLVDDCAGQLTRQAAWFASPPTVWWVRDRELHRVDPEPHLPAPAPSAGELAFGPDIEAAGATVVVEHGTVTGEVLGLEVARVTTTDGILALEVGIGRHDREAFGIIHGDRPGAAALAGVVGSVRKQRRADAPENPLYRIAQERWLREVVLARPDLAGSVVLERHEGPLPRPSVKDPWPAVAVGPEVVAVCSVGVDVDLVPYASDARAIVDPGSRLVLVVPERDAVALTRDLAVSLLERAEVVTVPDTWRSLA